MPDINLLSTDNKSPQFARGGASVALKVSTVVLVLVLLFYGYLWFALSQERKSLETWTSKTAQAQSGAMTRKDRSELITRQGQLQNVDGLITNHLYWSYLLPELARVTVRSSQYTTVSADANGTLTLTVVAPDYDDLDKYLQVFNLPQFNQQFSSVKILSLSKVQQGTALLSQMRIQLKFNPDFIRNRLK